MEVTAKYKDHVAFEVSAGRHTLICDQPVSNGGEDMGMTPPDFLLAALATCAGYYAAQYLRARSLSTEGLEVKVQAQKATQPARLDDFQIVIRSAVLEERHHEGLRRVVNACLVHNTLTHAPKIAVEVEPLAALAH